MCRLNNSVQVVTDQRMGRRAVNRVIHCPHCKPVSVYLLCNTSGSLQVTVQERYELHLTHSICDLLQRSEPSYSRLVQIRSEETSSALICLYFLLFVCFVQTCANYVVANRLMSWRRTDAVGSDSRPGFSVTANENTKQRPPGPVWAVLSLYGSLVVLHPLPTFGSRTREQWSSPRQSVVLLSPLVGHLLCQWCWLLNSHSHSDRWVHAACP